jgi:chromosome segregation ATPase
MFEDYCHFNETFDEIQAASGHNAQRADTSARDYDQMKEERDQLLYASQQSQEEIRRLKMALEAKERRITALVTSQTRIETQVRSREQLVDDLGHILGFLSTVSEDIQESQSYLEQVMAACTNPSTQACQAQSRPMTNEAG